MMTEEWWQDIFDKLDKMSDEEFEELLREVDTKHELFAIYDEESDTK